MAYVDRDANGVICGYYTATQREGQEWVEDNNSDLVIYRDGDPVNNMASSLKDALDILQEQKFCINCPCTVGQDSFSVQVRNVEDKTVLLAKMAEAKDYIEQSLPDTTVSIRCAGNITHSMTATQMVAMLRSIMAWSENISSKYHAHKDAIDALVVTIKDPQSTQQQVTDATASLTNYDISLNW